MPQLEAKLTRRRLLSERLLPAAALPLALASCGGDGAEVPTWRMKCSWTTEAPGLYEAAERLVAKINAQTAGRLKVSLVPSVRNEVASADANGDAFKVFDQVAAGEFELGHSSPQFWQGKSPAMVFFSGVPFGMTGSELNAWMLAGGGLALWRELYQHFGLMPFPAGNLGAQMAGWFSRDLRSLRGARGLKIRSTGLAAQIWERVGAQSVALDGVQINAALREKQIDGAEWMGPWQDLRLGLHEVSNHYYYPGWQDPGMTLECFVNQAAFQALAPELQASIESACLAAHLEETALNAARNQEALLTLVGVHKVNVRRLPQDLLLALSQASDVILAQLAEQDSFAKKVFDSAQNFREQAKQWQQVSDQAFAAARA